MKNRVNKLTHLNFVNTYVQLPTEFYARLNPVSLQHPVLVSASESAAELIDLDITEFNHPDFLEYFSGHRLLPGSQPLAMIYAGHQFGSYVPQLGDGRALLLGEVRNKKGEKWDLHLKGSGQTPFSRQGDGRAVLRSCIREYLCSEAMHHLGMPTSRALCVIGSEEKVYRETVETGAMLLRLAPTHVRFGTFEYFFYRQQPAFVQRLADYCIEQYFPALIHEREKYYLFFKEIVNKTARLIAYWQAYGFAHGVMNTDNMSILGLTFDYGPFGFLDNYDAEFICNHSDPEGRYAFDQQPAVGLWNLNCLAYALSSLVSQDALIDCLNQYEIILIDTYSTLMRKKLGFAETMPADRELVVELFNQLQQSHVDYTNFFRGLGDYKVDEKPLGLRDLFVDLERFDQWIARYADRLRAENSPDNLRRTRMNQANPKYILRNYLAQAAIEKAEKNDFSEVNRLLQLLTKPYDEQPDMASYAASPPASGKKIQVSCSS